MRAYRQTCSEESEAGRLSQTGLIALMAEKDLSYCDRYDHSTVSRWERGVTLPTHDHLEVFGRALKLSPSEVSGLLGLAGLGEADPHTQSGAMNAGEPFSASGEASLHVLKDEPSQREEANAAEFSSFGKRRAFRYAMSHLLLPASLVGVAGYILASYGWDSALATGLYVCLAVGLITFQSFRRIRRTGSIQELLYVTVFFLLNVPLLHGPLLFMDPYGIFSFGNLAGTSVPFTLSLIVSLLAATVSALTFAILSRWQFSRDSGDISPIKRSSWIVIPSVADCLLPPLSVLQCRILDSWLGAVCNHSGRSHGIDGSLRQIAHC